MAHWKSAVAALAFAVASGAAQAGTIVVDAPYARVLTALSKSGAAFLEIRNTAATPDRLIGAQTDAAAMAELHTHVEGENGVMRMVPVRGGIPIPAHGKTLLARGGDHIMLMGLKRPLKQGDVIHLTLDFEKAGRVPVDVPVDNQRKGPMAKMKMDH